MCSIFVEFQSMFTRSNWVSKPHEYKKVKILIFSKTNTEQQQQPPDDLLLLWLVGITSCWFWRLWLVAHLFTSLLSRVGPSDTAGPGAAASQKGPTYSHRIIRVAMFPVSKATNQLTGTQTRGSLASRLRAPRLLQSRRQGRRTDVCLKSAVQSFFLPCLKCAPGHISFPVLVLKSYAYLYSHLEDSHYVKWRVPDVVEAIREERARPLLPGNWRRCTEMSFILRRP